jgi:hypothetical protein
MLQPGVKIVENPEILCAAVHRAGSRKHWVWAIGGGARGEAKRHKCIVDSSASPAEQPLTPPYQYRCIMNGPAAPLAAEEAP